MEFIEKLMKLPNPQALGYEGIFEFLIQIHITFGLIALITGSVILALRKGSQNHKKIGRVFVVVMLGNFLLGVPLGTLGQLLVGEPANVMTVIGAMLVGTVTFSGYRLAKAKANARAWYDKVMLGIQILTAGLYSYFAALTAIGTDLLGLTSLTLEEAQFTLADNSFDIFGQSVQLISTTGGFVFAIMISENFVTPLFLSAVLFWFSYEDWGRIMSTGKYAPPAIIHQHLTRLIVAFSATVTAVLLNISWLSFWVDWSFPTVCGLALASYYRVYGYKRHSRKSLNVKLATE